MAAFAFWFGILLAVGGNFLPDPARPFAVVSGVFIAATITFLAAWTWLDENGQRP